MTRILIQHRMTGLYFKGLGSWTQFESEAFHFSSSTTALLFCVRHRLSLTQIVMKFGEQRYDIQLPIADEAHWDQRPSFAAR
jgi:hypothetical protein